MSHYDWYLEEVKTDLAIDRHDMIRNKKELMKNTSNLM